jgi:hypothetical protein
VILFLLFFAYHIYLFVRHENSFEIIKSHLKPNTIIMSLSYIGQQITIYGGSSIVIADVISNGI